MHQVQLTKVIAANGQKYVWIQYVKDHKCVGETHCWTEIELHNQQDTIDRWLR
jgi:hypothetical protein